MSRLLTVLHVYYHDQIDYFIDKLANIGGVEWDFIVTYSTYSQEIEDKLRAFKRDVVMFKVENIGYDVWPFIQVLKTIDFSKYDYILKLHTKGKSEIKLNGLSLKGWGWRDMLVDSILKSKSRFAASLNILEQDSNVGMVCSYELYKDLNNMMQRDVELLDGESKRISLTINDAHFCAGTMFLARLSVFEAIKEIDFTSELWGTESKSHVSCTLAHTYERIFGIMVIESGYRFERMMSSPLSSGLVYYKSNISPIFKKIFTLDRDRQNGNKYLMLMGVKINLPF